MDSSCGIAPIEEPTELPRCPPERQVRSEDFLSILAGGGARHRRLTDMNGAAPEVAATKCDHRRSAQSHGMVIPQKAR
jgi:hypothetical protein